MEVARAVRAWLSAERVGVLACATLGPASFALAAVGLHAAAAAAALVFAATAPGLACVRLLRRAGSDGDGGALALRTLALSPLAWIVLTGGAAAALGIGVQGAARVGAWLASGALAATALLRTRPGPARAPAPRRWRAALLAVAPCALVAAASAWVVAPVGVRFSYHGFLHAGIVAQLASGIVPPENPALAGEPIGFYWLFHWLLAGQAAFARVSLLEVSPFLDAVALVLYVGAAQRVLRRWLPPVEAALAALAAGFVGDLLFPAVFAARTVLEGATAAPYFWPFEVLQRGGFGGDPRSLPLLAKFLNAGGVAIGLGLWAALLAELVPERGARTRWPVVFLELVSVVLLHPTTALAAYAALAAGLFAVAVAEPAGPGLAGLATRARRLAPGAGVFTAALAVTAPFVLSVTVGTHAIAGPPLALRGSVLIYDARTTLLGGVTLVAIAASGLALGRRDPTELFLAVATAVLLVLGIVLELPDNNQYKFVLVAALPAGLLGVRLLGRVPARVRRAALAAGVALVLAGDALVLRAYRGSIMSVRKSPVGDGLYLALPGDPGLDRALRWLRENTPRDAVVVMRPVPFGGSPIAAVSGRSPFLLLGGQHTEHHPAAGRRLAEVRKLFDGDEDPSDALLAMHEELARPLYVLALRSQLGARYDAMRRHFDQATAWLHPVVVSPDVALYAATP